MRDKYTDEPDEAGEANRRGSDEGGSRQQYELDPFHIDAQLLGLVFVKLHDVEWPGMNPDDRQACQYTGKDYPDLRPVGQVKSTQQPEYDPVQLLAGNGHEIGGDRGQKGT